MNILTEEVIEEATPLRSMIDMREDQRLITDFVGSVRSAGVESLDYPAGKLIDRHLADKYPDHYKLGGGTEGLIALAAIIGGGFAAYKALIRGKKIKPVVDRTKDLVNKVEKQYPTDFPSKHKAVDKDIDAGQITRCFAGNNFASIKSAIESWTSKNDKTLDTIVKKTVNTFKAFEEANDQAMAAGEDKDAIKKIEVEMRKKYGNAPYECEFDASANAGKGGQIASISESDFAAARTLLLHLIDRFDKVNDILFEEMMFGYLDEGQGLDNLTDCQYIYSNLLYESWFDEVAGGIYGYIDELMLVAKSLETYIIKSFK